MPKLVMFGDMYRTIYKNNQPAFRDLLGTQHCECVLCGIQKFKINTNHITIRSFIKMQSELSIRASGSGFKKDKHCRHCRANVNLNLVLDVGFFL